MLRTHYISDYSSPTVRTLCGRQGDKVPVDHEGSDDFTYETATGNRFRAVAVGLTGRDKPKITCEVCANHPATKWART